jgi:hypothetical protein
MVRAAAEFRMQAAAEHVPRFEHRTVIEVARVRGRVGSIGRGDDTANWIHVHDTRVGQLGANGVDSRDGGANERDLQFRAPPVTVRGKSADFTARPSEK